MFFADQQERIKRGAQRELLERAKSVVVTVDGLLGAGWLVFNFDDAKEKTQFT
jgi:lipid-binding SYLF domain-containing protein